MRRICVLVVHGIGQQQRGECARSLARTVLRVCCRSTAIDSVHGLDLRFEKRRFAKVSLWLSTGQAGNLRVDFRELYWGPLACSSVGPVKLAWWVVKHTHKFSRAVLRGAVPRKMMWDGLQLLLCAALPVIGIWVAVWFLSAGFSMAIAGFAIVLLVWAFLKNYIADVVRYFCVSEYDADSRVRRRIQTAGVRMLKQLSRTEEHGYERVILVAHSLGTVILLDCMRLLHGCGDAAAWRRLGPIITAGSPLAKCEELALGREAFPCCYRAAVYDKTWVNFYCAWDAVADRLSTCTVFQGCVEDRAITGYCPLLCHLSYWNAPELAEAILESVMCQRIDDIGRLQSGQRAQRCA